MLLDFFERNVCKKIYAHTNSVYKFILSLNKHHQIFKKYINIISPIYLFVCTQRYKRISIKINYICTYVKGNKKREGFSANNITQKKRRNLNYNN